MALTAHPVFGTDPIPFSQACALFEARGHRPSPAALALVRRAAVHFADLWRGPVIPAALDQDAQRLAAILLPLGRAAIEDPPATLGDARVNWLVLMALALARAEARRAQARRPAQRGRRCALEKATVRVRARPVEPPMSEEAIEWLARHMLKGCDLPTQRAITAAAVRASVEQPELAPVAERMAQLVAEGGTQQ